MKIVTEREMIRSVLRRWEVQYPVETRKTMRFPSGKTAEQTWCELRMLDLNTATSDDIEAVIGNSSWTSAHCDECGSFARNGISVGSDPNHVFLCADCAGVVADRWCVLKELLGGGF